MTKSKTSPEKMREYRRAWVEKNPEQMRAARKAWQLANPDKVKDLHRAYMYGLAPGEYEALLASQGDCCAICQSPTPKGTAWHIDHDHVSDRVRGILCRTCNTSLGALGDNLAGLEAAVNYLRRHHGLTVETVDEHY